MFDPFGDHSSLHHSMADDGLGMGMGDNFGFDIGRSIENSMHQMDNGMQKMEQ